MAQPFSFRLSISTISILLSLKLPDNSAVSDAAKFLADRRYHSHITVTTAFADDPVPQKDKAVINMGDPGLVHVQPEFKTVFEHAPTLFPDGFRLCFGTFDNEYKIIGISAYRHIGNKQQRVSIASFP
ncbi:Uncharacterised protein [Yersinia pseudotuberculosis]|uniref:Uncharacterized protein n=1 Tax=Yersinia pseudotuberculosis TaxID=633 RepID=A0A380Q3B0_YERPU|nr:Uncharacterised protein [Yersinia pseudotuberculosis]SUP80268.1 Uncharacterised protein [Yersinia pseudotuberculosis]